MSPIASTRVSRLRRQYPELDRIADYPTNASLRLVWDRIFSLEERLQAAEATITSLVAGHNDNETSITTAQESADEALALRQIPGQPVISET